MRNASRRGPNQARLHDLIAAGLRLSRAEQEREAEIEAALRPAIAAAASEVLARIPMHANVRDDLTAEIAKASANAAVLALRDLESTADLDSVSAALRAGMTAATAIAMMSAAIGELMPPGGWPADGSPGAVHDVHVRIGAARMSLAGAQALLVAVAPADSGERACRSCSPELSGSGDSQSGRPDQLGRGEVTPQGVESVQIRRSPLSAGGDS